MYKEYIVWRRQHHGGIWTPTTTTLKARTDAEAQRRVRKLFEHAGFSSMSLVAVLSGGAP